MIWTFNLPTLLFLGWFKSLWKLQNDLEAKYGKEERQPGETIVIVGGDMVTPVLSSIADRESAGFRLSWLVWLQQFNEVGYLKFPWIEIVDATIKAVIRQTDGVQLQVDFGFNQTALVHERQVVEGTVS